MVRYRNDGNSLYTCRLRFNWDVNLLAVFRILLVVLVMLVLFIYAVVSSVLRPFHRDNVYHTAKHMGKIAKLLGLDIEVRIPESAKNIDPVVYICNHQNSYDLVTISGALQPNTVTVGKKSLKWIPVFGQMYWLTGNILIDRNNAGKAMNTISLTADKIKERGLSVLLFPEGTRSNGKGLLPFKRGAFLTAIQADVPIVPMCASNLHNTIKLNRWNNGKMIIEFLPPVKYNEQDKDNIRNISKDMHQLMSTKINQLDDEIKQQQLTLATSNAK